jgi:hypothetical protein
MNGTCNLHAGLELNKKIVVAKPKRKRSLWRGMCRWKNKIRVDLVHLQTGKP